MRAKSSNRTQPRRSLAFIQTWVGIVWESPYSSPATQSCSNSQNKKPAPLPSQKCGTESDTVAINSAGGLRFLSAATTERKCRLMLSGSMLPLQIQSEDFIYLFIFASFVLFFSLLKCYSDWLESQPSFQEENNHPVCAVAMAFIVLQKFALVCLFALIQ